MDTPEPDPKEALVKIHEATTKAPLPLSIHQELVRLGDFVLGKLQEAEEFFKTEEGKAFRALRNERLAKETQGEQAANTSTSPPAEQSE